MPAAERSALYTLTYCCLFFLARLVGTSLGSQTSHLNTASFQYFTGGTVHRFFDFFLHCFLFFSFFQLFLNDQLLVSFKFSVSANVSRFSLLFALFDYCLWEYFFQLFLYVSTVSSKFGFCQLDF